jgi:hypothetical protein
MMTETEIALSNLRKQLEKMEKEGLSETELFESLSDDYQSLAMNSVIGEIFGEEDGGDR